MAHRLPDPEMALSQTALALRTLELGFDRPNWESFDGQCTGLSALFGIMADYLDAVIEQDRCDRERKERVAKTG